MSNNVSMTSTAAMSVQAQPCALAVRRRNGAGQNGQRTAFNSLTVTSRELREPGPVYPKLVHMPRGGVWVVLGTLLLSAFADGAPLAGPVLLNERA